MEATGVTAEPVRRCSGVGGEFEPGRALNMTPLFFFPSQVSGELVSVAHALSLPAESYGNDVSMTHPQLPLTQLPWDVCRA